MVMLTTRSKPHAISLGGIAARQKRPAFGGLFLWALLYRNQYISIGGSLIVT
jgi:hypothetical protein